MEPGGREPAPGSLRLVQAFINTNDIEGRHDEFSSPAKLGVWLAHHRLLGPEQTLDAMDLQVAVEVREALRMLALGNSGRRVDPTAVETLNRSGMSSFVQVQFDAAGMPRLEPAQGGLPGAVGQILANVYTAMVDGTWPRLKACQNDVCRWVFYDHSKNRSGTWCTMAICGDKLKARAYRRRKQTGTAM